MKKILTILILLMPFLGIAQGSTFPYATIPVTQQKIIKGSDKIWTFTKTGGKLYYVDKNGSVEVPDAAGFIAASRTLTLTAGTGISITGGTQDLSANRTWTIGVSSLGNASIASGANIDASKLGTGIVSTTVFNYLANVTSDIQTQFNNIGTTYMPYSGGRFTGGVTFANNTSTSSFSQMVSSFGSTGNLQPYYLTYQTKFGANTISYDILAVDGNTGFVGVGQLSPPEKLSVTGNILASGNLIGVLKTITGAGVNKVLTSDASGVGAWATPSTSNITEGTNLYFTDARVRGAALTGYTSGAGTVAATDNVLQAIQKLNGNIGLKQDALTNPVTGSGTSGYLLKYTGATSVGNSGLIESSGKFGIGTASPTQKLSINGNIEVMAGAWNIFRSGDGSNYAHIKNPSTSNSELAFVTNGEKMRIDGNGNVGIGTAAPIDLFSVGSSSQFQVSAAGKVKYDATITATGTTGNQTINKPSGCVNMAAGTSSITVTNSLVTTSTIIQTTVQTDDTTAIIKNVVPSSGSFVIKTTANTTAETKVCFIVYN